MSRMPTVAREAMSEAQLRVVEKIEAGPRKGFYGPFVPLIHSPELLDRVQALGLLCRYQSSFPPALSELLILVSARHWTAQFEWHSHVESAIAAGVPAEAIEAIRTRREPHFTDPDQALIHAFAHEFYNTGRVGDASFDAVVRRFGHRGMVDLVGIMGYYGLIAMSLNIFEQPLPDGVSPPLDP
ncbi:MAG: carboxymuconolactone decarboxylase family protein [Gammaproteobacteria bacterium]|nr:carboxymuconolactone decarboxylase family protein [Gammaproteobacteria bacterium]